MTELTDIEWRWKRFDDLTTTEVYDMRAARSAVFVVEQNCVYGDIDGHDVDGWHLFALHPANRVRRWRVICACYCPVSRAKARRKSESGAY